MTGNITLKVMNEISKMDVELNKNLAKTLENKFYFLSKHDINLNCYVKILEIRKQEINFFKKRRKLVAALSVAVEKFHKGKYESFLCLIKNFLMNFLFAVFNHVKEETIIDVCKPRWINESNEKINLWHYDLSDKELNYLECYLKYEKSSILQEHLEKILKETDKEIHTFKHFVQSYIVEAAVKFGEWALSLRNENIKLSDLDKFIKFIKSESKLEEELNIIEDHAKCFLKENIDMLNVRRKVLNYFHAENLQPIAKKLMKIRKVRNLKGDFSILVEFSNVIVFFFITF